MSPPTVEQQPPRASPAVAVSGLRQYPQNGGARVPWWWSSRPAEELGRSPQLGHPPTKPTAVGFTRAGALPGEADGVLRCDTMPVTGQGRKHGVCKPAPLSSPEADGGPPDQSQGSTAPVTSPDQHYVGGPRGSSRPNAQVVSVLGGQPPLSVNTATPKGDRVKAVGITDPFQTPTMGSPSRTPRKVVQLGSPLAASGVSVEHLGNTDGSPSREVSVEISPPVSPAFSGAQLAASRISDGGLERQHTGGSLLAGAPLSRDRCMASERMQLALMASRRQTLGLATDPEQSQTGGQAVLGKRVNSIAADPDFVGIGEVSKCDVPSTVVCPLDVQRRRTLVDRGVSPEDIPTLTTEQVKQYHTILDGLTRINGMHAAVSHPSGNLFWDFKSRRCLPGRVWEENAPPEVRDIIAREYTDEEVATAAATVRLSTARSVPPNVHPRALLLIGPAAAGKSMILRKVEDIMGLTLQDYVEIDGDELRLCHGGWTEVLSNLTTGYKDAYEHLKPFSKRLKVRFLKEAMKGRKNLLLPTTGSQPKKLMEEYKMLRKAGYKVDMIGLVVSYKEAKARGLNRAHENGRYFGDASPEKWRDAMRAIQFFADPKRTNSCIVFDNEDFANPQTIYTRTHTAELIDLFIEQYCERDELPESPTDAGPQGIFALDAPPPSATSSPAKGSALQRCPSCGCSLGK